MKNVSDRSHIKKIRFFFSEDRAVYEIMWKNIVQPDRPHDNMIWRVGFTCWITNATDTHAEYVIFIISPRQQWFH
jgi:hypothetical protein